MFFLNISPRAALARKGSFTSLETGHSGGGDEDFIRYQDTVLNQMREQAQRGAWLSLDVATIDRDQVFKAASVALADRLQPTV
ncbi:hypothetical protein SHKM778_28730 [Streptomyces sp. KM77-8]|uniref:Uncharacterized protein n=1 Tax=Streptomyces haneummycinicus TaxID=3074435 RepID=A0AAT9HG68_9ACTN